MIKLYKVTVNNWGCSAPKTIYATSKEAAEQIASKYPASDPVQYAGRYAEENAVKILAQYGEDEGKNLNI